MTIYAQEYNYVIQRITSKDGLASNKANCILQDKKGFYWIGTDSGLQRFDGKYFISVPIRRNNKVNDSSTESIKSPILEDKEGNIWGLNGTFISIYYPQTGERDRIAINDDTINSPITDIRYFCKDQWENIWIITNLNLYKYDYSLHTSIFWLKLPEMNADHLRKITYDKTKDALWIVGGPQILCFDLKSNSITLLFSIIPSMTELSGYEYPIGLWMDSRQNLWFNDWQRHVFKYNTITYQKKVYAARAFDDKTNTTFTVMAKCFSEDADGRVIIGTLDGLYYFDEVKDSLLQIHGKNTMQYKPSWAKEVNDIFPDNNGNIFACLNDGIDVLTQSHLLFNNINKNNASSPFPNVDVTGIFERRNGDIFVGTFGKGWYVYDKDFILKQTFYENEPFQQWPENRKNKAWCFTEDLEGKIWIGYQGGLIGILDPSGEQVQYIDVPEFGGWTIRSIKCDKKGNIWFGLHSGSLGKWSIADRKFHVFRNSELFPMVNWPEITDILINKKQEIWISTARAGFSKFDPVLEKNTEIHLIKNSDSIPDVIFSLSQINDSIIGVSTQSNGAIFFNENHKTIKAFTRSNGLIVNSIDGIAVDKQQNTWMVTNDGLFRLNAGNNKIVLFDENDGILVKDFNGNIVTLHDGRMVMPTTTGFVYFSPDNVNPLDSTPNVKITNFKIFNTTLLIDSLLSNRVINLTYEQNFITINYSALSFSGRNTMQYTYQLVGINEDWINAGNGQSASYTNLSPGHYTFKVKCENRDGIVSKDITTLLFYIHPPWWATKIAYLIYSLVGVSIVYTAYRNRIHQIENKQEAQIKTMVATQEDERKRISRDLHDDIGTKLSALKLFLSSLGQKASVTNNEEIKSLAATSEQFIKEAMQDVRQLLLNLSPTVLEEFGYTTAVEGLINKINGTKQIHFNLVVFGMKQRMKIDYELALYRITQELINNVLKHAQAKNVSLQIGQRDEKIILMIEDDGKGFDVLGQKDGYGLNNLHARTKLMHGTIAIDSHPGKGTSVLIEVPYHSNGI